MAQKQKQNSLNKNEEQNMKEFISRMKVVKTIERLTKVKNEFDSAECEMFMPVWATETYLNTLKTRVTVEHAETQIECPRSEVGSAGPKKHSKNSQ